MSKIDIHAAQYSGAARRYLEARTKRCEATIEAEIDRRQKRWRFKWITKARTREQIRADIVSDWTTNPYTYGGHYERLAKAIEKAPWGSRIHLDPHDFIWLSELP